MFFLHFLMLLTHVHDHRLTTSVCAINVGANVGWYSFSVASRGYRIAAFEAMASNVQLIQQALCLNSRSPRQPIKLYKVALGAKAEACYVYSGDNNVGNGVTLCGAGNRTAAIARIPEHHLLRGTTHVRRLDHILNEDIQAGIQVRSEFEPRCFRNLRISCYADAL